jgi:hypothetical protein
MRGPDEEPLTVEQAERLAELRRKSLRKIHSLE